MTPAERELWRRADGILERLLDLPQAQRAARLEALSPEPLLRARVERLLAAHERGDGMLDRPPANAPADAFAGRRLGRWRLECEIGRGGMAVVYRARSLEGPAGQDAALKLLTLGALAASGRERFVREQQALLRLRHPYIAPLYDAGFADDGTPWLAMARVEGERIDAWCDARALDAAARVRLLLQVCEAVAHAHRNLVIHRDIKPSNVLVDGDGRVRLLDFGIARFADAGEECTRTGLRALTPEYAAPEQFAGAPAATTMDVYGIGALLYRLLAGVPPRGAGARERSAPPAAPSRVAQQRAQAGGAARPRLPRSTGNDLDAIVLKALAAEPEARYPSVDALADDLGRWLDGLPVRAQPPSLRYRMRKFAARHRLPIAAAALVLLALLGGAAATLWQAGVAREQAARARLAAEQSQVQLGYLQSVLDVLAPGTEATREMDRQEMIAEAARRARRELAGRPSLLARVELGLGDVARRTGGYRQAQALFADALRLRKAVFGSDSAEYGEALMHLGSMTDRVAPPDPALAEARLRRAVVLLRRHRAPPQVQVQALNQHADKLTELGRYGDARAVLGVAGGHCGRAPRHGEDCDQVWRMLGELERRENRFPEAIAAYRQLLELRRQRLGEDHAQTAIAYARLGHALVRAGETARGLRLLERARALDRRTNATPTGESLQTLCDLAEAYRASNRRDRAQALLEQYLSGVRGLFGERSVEFAYGLSQLGALHHQGDDFARAADAYRRSHAIYAGLLGERAPPTAFALGRYADALNRQGLHAQALAPARRALAIQRKVFGEASSQAGERWSHLGNVLLGLGRQAEALDAYTRAARIFAPASATIVRQRAFANRSRRGVALFALGRTDEGLREVRAALADAQAIGDDRSVFHASVLADLVELTCRSGLADECARLQRQVRAALQAGRDGGGRLKLEHALAATGE